VGVGCFVGEGSAGWGWYGELIRGGLAGVGVVRILACVCVYAGMYVYVCLFLWALFGWSLCERLHLHIEYAVERSRGWEETRVSGREIENFALELGKESIASIWKLRRAGPSRDDVNTARSVRSGPSCDVKLRYRDALLWRKILIRHKP
jgi:hypothetical protein